MNNLYSKAKNEKILDVLRKLGVFRSGSASGTYTSVKDRPTEFLMDDIYNSKKI